MNYKDVISRILTVPRDGRTKNAKNFWTKETVFFKKLYKQFPNDQFWEGLSLQDTTAKSGRIPSLSYFFDKKSNYWIKILKRKWKLFNWTPPKIKSYNFQNNCQEKIDHKKSRKTLRDFFN